MTIAFALTGCFRKDPPNQVEDTSCAEGSVDGAGSGGSASVFNPDPISATGNQALSPSLLTLDDYRASVTLSNLGGHGLLEGKYVYSLNEKSCRSSGFGAFDDKNQFNYSHKDQRFQETMAYYFGDRYRSYLDSAEYLYPANPVPIWAICDEPDNALYSQTAGAVCLGYSTTTPGAYYADDGLVTIHELQHATTTSLYTQDEPGLYLNPLWVSEGGALNEGISDFMGLLSTEELTDSRLDPKLFGRWALKLFDPSSDGTRGANRCPAYDSSYPGCANFPSFSAQNNTISYVYPDGIGWPYGKNSHGPEYAKQAYLGTTYPEEIHNAGVLIQGALWDAYEGVRAANGGDAVAARLKMTRLTLEAIRALPKPTDSQVAPISFIAFADALVQRSSLASLAFTPAERQAVADALAARGLQPTGSQLLPANWADIGTGSLGSGIKILDNPAKLTQWTMRMLGRSTDPGLIPQGVSTGLNGTLDPGEVVVVWFDIKNTSAITAGAVQVTVTIPDAEKDFIEIHPGLNFGVLSPQKAQINYAKINGTQIVSALSTVDGAHSSFAVPTGNSFFLTQPFYDQTWWTGIWMRVKPGSSGQTVHFNVEAKPSNGAASTVIFPARIN